MNHDLILQWTRGLGTLTPHDDGYHRAFLLSRTYFIIMFY